MTTLKVKQLCINAQAILQDDVAIIAGALTFGSILYLGLQYADIEQMRGNLGIVVTYSQLILHGLLALIFGLFIAASIYKIRWMKQRSPTKTSSGLFGGLVSGIIIGCPACSIGLASYLGVGSLLMYLPGFGLEFKFLGLILLTWATYVTLGDLFVCKR